MMKKQLRSLLAVLLAAVLCTGLMPAAAFAKAPAKPAVPDTPKNGIPLVIVHIDEKAEGFGTIDEMNTSENHTVRCTGSIEIKTPEGYAGGYGTYELPEGELPLDYIRGRGNTTWAAPKKPYKIQLKKSTDLFGMGKSKDWALMANAYDASLMKNRLTYWIGEKLGMVGTPQQVPVDVVMKGDGSSTYLGSYTLSETVKVEKSRVPIDKLTNEDASLTGEPNITGGYLLSYYTEFQNSDEPASTVFKTKAGMEFINKTPSYDDTETPLTAGEEAQRQYIRNYVQEIEDLIMTEGGIDAATHQKLAERMDLTSAADFWWINEFSENGDAYGTSSTYLYKGRNGKLCWGPLWDFDLSWGDPGYDPEEESGYGFSNTFDTWIDALRKNDPEFRKLISERWKVLKPVLEEALADGGIIDQYREEVRASQKDDFALWGTGDEEKAGWEDYDRTIANLKKWIRNRYKFCDAHADMAGCMTAKVTYEVDGKEFKSEEKDLWSRLSADVEPPEKEGYVFTGWREKETGTPAEEYLLESDVTLVPVYLSESEAVAPEALFFQESEQWVPLQHEACYLNYEILPENATRQVIRVVSSDETIAQTDGSEVIRLIAPGDVTLTASTYNGITAKVKLHVYDSDQTKPVMPKKVTVKPSKLTLKKGQVEQLSYSLAPAKKVLSYGGIEYSSSRPSVAEVDAFGVVTAKKKGKAVITMTVMDPDYKPAVKAVCSVTVKNAGEKKNTLAVKGKTVKVSAKALASGSVVVKKAKVLKVTGAKGKVSFDKVSVSPKAAAKAFAVNKKTGDVTVKKKTKPGTYRLTMKVTADGNDIYKEASKRAVVTIRVR